MNWPTAWGSQLLACATHGHPILIGLDSQWPGLTSALELLLGILRLRNQAKEASMAAREDLSLLVHLISPTVRRVSLRQHLWQHFDQFSRGTSNRPWRPQRIAIVVKKGPSQADYFSDSEENCLVTYKLAHFLPAINDQLAGWLHISVHQCLK